jgi:NAD(P)-dependent dehydrogenase (short-subunit alcohol dehydrogenase family)
MIQNNTIEGKTIVITGAARGLGFVLAKAAINAGAFVILADILTELGEKSALSLGKNARFIPVDLGDLKSIETFASQIKTQVDGLINCGAIATNVGGKSYDEIDPALFEKVLAVNVMGTWAMIKAITPMMHQGRIVNIASDTALWGAPKLLAYVASKGAIIAMTRSLARELGEKRIGITCVAPGIMKTESTEYVPQARHDFYENGRAIKGEQHPEDIAATVLFLLSDGALTLTGQCLPVDAGFVFT